MTQALDLSRNTQESAIQESTRQDHDSNPPALKKGGDRTVYSPYIAAVILDYSRELDDVMHGPVNVSQALHLWHGSGLSEENFVTRLHESRARTRTAQGAQGRGQITRKMAYFFAILQDLLGPSTTREMSHDDRR